MAHGKKVAVVDDDQAVRESLACLLTVHGYDVETFASGDKLLARTSASRFSCLLLDVQMPGKSGLDVIRELRGSNSLPPTVVLTGHGTVGVAVEAMKLGAHDFLQKPYAPADLISAVERSCRASNTDRSGEGLQNLPPRQLDVLKGLMKGQPNKIIAYELGLSTRTVEHYRAALMARVGVKTLPELVRMGIAAGL